MIVKIPVYFELETDENAKIEHVDLLKDRIANELEDYLKGSSKTIAGSWWNSDRIKATFVTADDALKSLSKAGK